MALTEKSRSSLYQGLAPIVGEEATAEMLSFFPARDGDELVTREHLDRRFAEFREEMHHDFAEFREAMHHDFAEFREEMHHDFAEFREAVHHGNAGFREGMHRDFADLRAEMHTTTTRMLVWMTGTMIATAGVIISAVAVIVD